MTVEQYQRLAIQANSLANMAANPTSENLATLAQMATDFGANMEHILIQLYKAEAVRYGVTPQEFQRAGGFRAVIAKQGWA